MDTVAARTAPTESAREITELEEGLRRVYTCLERADLEQARSVVKELESRWPDDARVQRYAYVLAPPRVIVQETGSGRRLEEERAWLRAHRREYPGCWLAVHKDTLIAADPSLDVVLLKARETVGEENVVLYLQR